jgi:ribosome silencing factor RsfS/YbeB/iojap
MSKSISKRATAAHGQGLPEQVLAAVTAAADRKAEDVVVLDLRGADGFTDYFVICTGQNPRQIKAIADAVEEALRRDHVKPAHIEGYGHAECCSTTSTSSCTYSGKRRALSTASNGSGVMPRPSM